MKICFLYGVRPSTAMIKELAKHGAEVELHSGLVEDLSAYDQAISFGYRHILRPSTLASAKRPILNLHISMLPFNKGAHPNFWSWIERTPSGVSIHEIDRGIDTGPIVAQRKLEVKPDGLTFRHTYSMLVTLVTELFSERCSDILTGDYVAQPQSGPGTFHRSADLPNWMTTWDMEITEAIEWSDRSG